MKNKVLYLFFSFVFIIFIGFSSSYINASSSEYQITSYNTDIKVNENNSYDITEKISMNALIPKHGIYRKIPLINNISRLDGTVTQNRARIKNIKVNDEYDTSTEDSYKVIKIGDDDSTFTGKKDYTISYTYNMGKDRLKTSDEFYFNIVGTQWDTTISNPTFKITMPKEFDETKLGFSSGKYGSVENSRIEYTVNGKEIVGRYNGTLSEGEGITVRLELPDRYFITNDGILNNVINISLLLIPIIFTIISFVLWCKYGKDKRVVSTVEFYPPDDLNSLELAYAYKGGIDNKDITSLLIYLANKGYVKIEEGKNKSDFVITKLKEYDGNDKNEQEFFDGLFEKKDQVTKSDLENKFYKTMDKIKSNMSNRDKKYKLFDKKASKTQILVIVLIVLSLLCMITKPLLECGFEMFDVLLATFIPLVGILMFAFVFSPNKEFKLSGLFGAMVFGILGFIFSLPLVMEALQYEMVFVITYIIGAICVMIQGLFLRIMTKRTEYGIEILGKIIGFKNFLARAEKNKLEELVLKDPKYFYNILPYTYVLGISDKWINKFESISIEPPDWYYGSSTFDMIVFSSFINSTMDSATNSMSSMPSNSGGYSGGGFSGGGAGGGGGGSW